MPARLLTGRGADNDLPRGPSPLLVTGRHSLARDEEVLTMDDTRTKTVFKWWDSIDGEEHVLTVTPSDSGITLGFDLGDREEHALTVPRDLLGDLVGAVIAGPTT